MLNPAVLSHPSEFLTQWIAEKRPLQNTIENFLADKTKRYALGRNENSLLLSQDIPLAGIVDDFAAEIKEWNGLPVVRKEDVPQDAILVNAATAIRPVTAEKNARSRGTNLWLNHSDLYQHHPSLFRLPDFVVQNRETITKSSASFENLYSQFSDDESRKIFLDIIRYRLTGDPMFMREYQCRMNDQYFESFFDFPPNGVFIDAGGFDGETSIEFSSRYSEYGEIHIFEPSTLNYENVISALVGIRDVNAHKFGLSDKEEILRFSGENGSASKISETGSDSISVKPLDSFEISRIDFIKMDLEGWELHALKGARRAILKNHPILAISAYHHPQDFISIFNFVLSIRKDYDIYLRHYTEGWTESILYFSPKK